MADQIRELVIKVTVEADAKPLDEVGESSDKASTKAVALGTVIGNLVTKLGEMAVAAVKAGAAMVKDLVFGTAEAADEIAKTSAKLGVASDQLQRLRGAAQLSGADISALDSGLKDLQKNIGEGIEKGAGPAVEALATLGLEVAEVDALLQEGDIEGALGLIGDRANALGDPVRKQAALLKLMGDAGNQLGPLLASGSEGVKELGDRISATGEVIDKEALASFEAMQDNLRDIEGRVQGAKNQIAIALAPAVSDIADRIEAWIDENQDFIQQDLPAILEGVGQALISVAEFLFDLLKSWREFIRDATDLAEILAEKLGPTIDVVVSGFQTFADVAGSVATAMGDVAFQILEAVGASDELIKRFRELTSFGDDGETRVARGAGARFTEGAALEGGGARQGTQSNIGGRALFVDDGIVDQANKTRDTTRLRAAAADTSFSEADRARMTEIADFIDQSAADEKTVEAAREAKRRSDATQASRERARAAQRQQRRFAARQAPSKGGGAAREEGSIEDLITSAVGGASPAALRSATSALSGTLLVTNDNRIQITVESGAVQAPVTVSAALPTEVGTEASEAIERAVRVELGSQIRDVVEVAQARRNVGP